MKQLIRELDIRLLLAALSGLILIIVFVAVFKYFHKQSEKKKRKIVNIIESTEGEELFELQSQE